MSDLTEVDIFSCMVENLRSGISHCADLATQPRKGENYRALRAELKLIEGSCRQAAAFRDNSNWLDIGMKVEGCHRLAQKWLSGVKNPVTGERRFFSEKYKFDAFTALGDQLKALHAKALDMKTRAHGTLGMITPEVREAPHRQTKDAYAVKLPDGMMQRNSGLIIPASMH